MLESGVTKGPKSEGHSVFPGYRFNAYPFFPLSLRKILCGVNSPTLTIMFIHKGVSHLILQII